MLTVCTQTAEGKKLIAGTVFDGQPRIVRMRDMDIEFTPEGYILVLSYEDHPGIVGRIASILGSLHLNIASLRVGGSTTRGRRRPDDAPGARLAAPEHDQDRAARHQSGLREAGHLAAGIAVGGFDLHVRRVHHGAGAAGAEVIAPPSKLRAPGRRRPDHV